MTEFKKCYIVTAETREKRLEIAAEIASFYDEEKVGTLKYPYGGLSKTRYSEFKEDIQLLIIYDITSLFNLAMFSNFRLGITVRIRQKFHYVYTLHPDVVLVVNSLSKDSREQLNGYFKDKFIHYHGHFPYMNIKNAKYDKILSL